MVTEKEARRRERAAFLNGRNLANTSCDEDDRDVNARYPRTKIVKPSTYAFTDGCGNSITVKVVDNQYIAQCANCSPFSYAHIGELAWSIKLPSFEVLNALMELMKNPTEEVEDVD